MKTNTLLFMKTGAFLLALLVALFACYFSVVSFLFPIVEEVEEPVLVSIIPFEYTLDMNDPVNRQKFLQLTNLEFPDSVQWENARITYNSIPQHIFEGSARMTRKDFDTIFAKVSFREYGDHIGSPDHPYHGTADFPRSNCNLRVGYERSFETNKADNPETLVHVLWYELRTKYNKNDSPFTPAILEQFLRKSTMTSQ